MKTVIRSCLFSALATIAAMVLSTLIDDNLGWSWPTNVVRNWQEFGLIKIHGQMVYNPGGFKVLEHPQIYGGMSPACLYPAFFTAEIFSWTGQDTLPFHILLALVIFWASWRLLGRDNFAMLAAAAVILCPGYLRWPKILDPNTLAVLPVLPFTVVVLAILKKPRLTPTLLAALIVLTLAFMSLNWTTAWVCGPCIFLLLATPGINRRGLVTVIAAIVTTVPLVVLVSFAVKYGHIMSQSASGGPLSIFAGYTWGSGGYGQGQSAARLFLRLAFTNIVGLLPLWLLFVYALAQHIHNGARLSWLIFAPLALTVADVVIMRNYFGHHPWMAGPVLLVGAIFSLAALRASTTGEVRDIREKTPLKVAYVVALLSFIYGFAVLTFYRANETELLMLIKLVREHTARSDTLVVLRADSDTAGLVDRLEEPLDRHVVVMDNFEEPSAQGHCVILSSVTLDGAPRLIAKSTAESHSWLTHVTEWFNRSIAHRRSGDRLELPGTYYLYAPGR